MSNVRPLSPDPDGSPLHPAAFEVLRAALEGERENRRCAEAKLEGERAERRTAEVRAARLEAWNTESGEQIRRLEHLIEEFRKALYGKKSEKLDVDDRQLSFEDIGTAIEEAGGQPEGGAEEAPAQRRRRSSGERRSGRLPKELPRITQVIEPDSIACPCGCGAMSRIGEERSERLDIVPAQFRVIETVRPRYACNRCKAGGVIQAPAPASLIEGGLPTEGLLAHVLISKYADHQPLYRQTQIYNRSGIDLHRATLAHWVGRTAFHLAPLVDCLAAELKGSSKLFMDETTVPVLDPGRGRTKTGYLWALARDDRPWGGSDPPGVVYFYAAGRSGTYGETFLKGFTGTLQVDGYAGYNRLTRADRPGGAVTRAYCWAHVRRKLKEVLDSSGSPIARAGLQRIARLYAIEKDIRGLPPAQRQAIRWQHSAPIVNTFGVWLDEQRSRVSARSRLGEKLSYIANLWDGLVIFLYDGCVEMDSNPVENLIRPIKLNRKNALFAGHDEGAAAWARIATLIETCKLNGVEPHAWLKATLEKPANGHPQSRIKELLPWAFVPTNDQSLPEKHASEQEE